MTNKITNVEEIAKYEQDLTEHSKSLNKLRLVGESDQKYPDLKDLYKQVQALAANIPAPLSNANILNTDIKTAKTSSDALESQIGELINNIHNALQTKMMLNACISAEKSCKLVKWSCFWAAVAATVALVSVLLVLFLG